MRIAIGGFMHESNTFASLPADRERFREGSLTYGPAMVPVWREAHHEVGGFIAGRGRARLRPRADWAWRGPRHPARSLTSSSSTSSDTLVAGSTHGEDRRRADRAARGDGDAAVSRSPTPRCCGGCAKQSAPDVPLAATLDFHGNVSPAMAEYANVLIGYQTYPHIDQRQRGILVAELLTRAVRGEIRPRSRRSPSRR